MGLRRLLVSRNKAEIAELCEDVILERKAKATLKLQLSKNILELAEEKIVTRSLRARL